MLVGRSRQLELFEKALKELAEGVGSQWLLQGEAGIGKSALLEELRKAAGGHGFPVVMVTLLEGEARPPLWPWTETIFERVAALSPATRRRLFQELGANNCRALLSLVPELAAYREDPEEPGGPGGYPVAGRLTLLSAIRRFLDLASREGPWVLLCDNVDRFDSSSTQFLRTLMPSFRSLPVLICATSRTGSGLPADDKRMALLEYLSGDNATGLEMPPLRLGEVRLLAEYRKVELRDGMEEKILSLTGGNPLFVLELLRKLEVTEPSALQSSPFLTHRIRSLVRSRLSALPEESARLLRIAAILGRRVSQPELLAVSPTVPTIGESLSRAEEHGFLEVDEEGELRFAHDIVRKAILSTMTRAERAGWNEAIGRALERHYGEESSDHAERLGRFFLKGATTDSVNRGVGYTLLAANRALAAYGWESALAMADRVLRKYGSVLTRDRAARLRLVRGSALFRLGRRFEAIEEYRSLADYFYQLGDLTAMNTLLANHSYIEAGDVEVFDLAEKAVEITPPQSEHAFSHRYRYAFACNAAVGRYERALEESDSSIELAVNGGNPIAEAAARSHRSYVLVKLRRTDEAKRELSMVPTFELRDAPAVGAYNFLANGQVALREGRLSQAISHYQRYERATEYAGDAAMLATAHYFLAKLHLYRGEFENAKQHAREIERLAPTQGNAYHQEVVASYYQGKIEEGDQALKKLHRLVEARPRYRGTTPANFGCCVALRYMVTGEDRWVDAAATILETLLRAPATHPTIAVRAAFGLTCILFDRWTKGFQQDKAALRLAEEGLRPGERYSVFGDFYVLYAKGLQEYLNGHKEIAFATLRKAAEEASRVSQLPARAVILTRLANVSGSSSQREEARRLARELRMEPLLSRLDSRPLLTSREKDILRLVAEGMTNQEIGAELRISVHTVAHHVAHILQKTDTGSRTEAVRAGLKAGIISVPE